MDWIRSYFKKYWVDAHKADQRNTSSNILGFLSGIVLVLLGLFFMSGNVHPPQFSELNVGNGILSVIEIKRRVSYAVLLDDKKYVRCDYGECGSIDKNLEGSQVKVWWNNDRIWQVEINGKVVSAYEDNLDRAQGRFNISSVSIVLGLLFLIAAPIMQWQRFRNTTSG